MTKKQTIISTIGMAAVLIALTPAISSGEFDLSSLNAQVQNHEARITQVEDKTGITPSPAPEATINQAAAGTPSSGPSLATEATPPADAQPATTPAPTEAASTPTPVSGGDWRNGWTSN